MKKAASPDDADKNGFLDEVFFVANRQFSELAVHAAWGVRLDTKVTEEGGR